MTVTRKSTTNPIEAATTGVQPQTRSLAFQFGRFILHLLEMLLAMGAGMGLFHLLTALLPASSSLAAALAQGTSLHAFAMMFFMTVPMVAWMIVRGHGWRHSLEMGVAMLAPMVTVAVLCQLGVDAYLPWLAAASCPAMFLGMLFEMLYRREHYTGNHAAHAAQAEGEPSCHAG